MTIRSMFIDVPDYWTCISMGKMGTCKQMGWGEIRARAISFDGVEHYRNESTGYCHCHSCPDPDKYIDLDTDYEFSGTKVLCKIELDIDDAPSGPGDNKLYTIKYYFRFPGDTEDRDNELKFNLP